MECKRIVPHPIVRSTFVWWAWFPWANQWLMIKHGDGLCSYAVYACHQCIHIQHAILLIQWCLTCFSSSYNKSIFVFLSSNIISNESSVISTGLNSILFLKVLCQWWLNILFTHHTWQFSIIVLHNCDEAMFGIPRLQISECLRVVLSQCVLVLL